MTMQKFTSVNEYFSSLSGEVKQRLEQIRAKIFELAPNAEERISYNIPGYFVGDKVVVYISGYAHHVSIYPGRIASEAHVELAKEYMSGKSTLKFPNDKRLPLDLIEEFIKLRLQEVA